MSLADVFGPSEKVTIPANELVEYFRAEARTYAENTAMINGLRANLPADHILIMIGKTGTDCMRKEIIEETSPEPEEYFKNEIPRVGTRIEIIDTKIGCTGAIGKVGIITNEEPTNGLLKTDPGYNVKTLDGEIWRINPDAKIEILR